MLEIGYGQQPALEALLKPLASGSDFFPICRESREWLRRKPDLYE